MGVVHDNQPVSHKTQPPSTQSKKLESTFCICSVDAYLNPINIVIQPIWQSDHIQQAKIGKQCKIIHAFS